MNLPPIPYRMQSLERDHRGYPIPFIVWRDTDNRPHFTINDAEVVALVLSDRRCSICGKPLENNMWAIGGPLSAIHQHGAYIDPLVHKDCGTFALKTCPYIALPSWNDQKRIDAKTVKPEKTGGDLVLQDMTMIPEKPVFFCFAKTSGYKVSQADHARHYVHPNRPWKAMEFWRNGQQITQQEASDLFNEKEGHRPETYPYWPKGNS